MIRVLTALCASSLVLPVAAQTDIAGQVLDLVSRSVQLVYSIEDLEGRIDALEVNETDTEIRIDLAADVLFAFDSAEIQVEATDALEQAAAVIRERATGEVLVEGHTDAKGEDEYNRRLSERRAAAVRDWFVQRAGLTSVGFVTRGFGESRPVAPNANPDGSDSPENRQKNRRVEIRVRK